MLALLLLLASGPVRAAYMIPGSPIRPKDFTLVKKDGVYHLFFIRHNTSVPYDSTENDFGHAVSTDLYHWTQESPVMHVDSLGWDNTHVWAPYVFERDGLWWMFYTGITVQPGAYNQTQRMGLAVSPDLWNWTRVGGGPIFDASQTSWAFWNNSLSWPGFRDPFVMPDPAHPGGWLMYYTASYDQDSLATVVGVAGSSGDFTQWYDVKPLLITWRNYTYNQLTESPHVFQHDGTWFLFITTNAGQPLSYYTSLDPVGDPAAWTYRGRLQTMLGFDTSTWFASEYFQDGTHELFCFLNGDRVEMREMTWTDSLTFALIQPPLLHVVRMDWESSDVWSNEHATLKTTIANPLAGRLDLQLLAVDSTGTETIVPPDSVGFTTSPQVWSDTSYVTWVARRWPAVPDSDTVSVSRFRVRCSDLTAESGIVTVHGPRPPEPPAPAPPDTTSPPPDPDPEPIQWMLRHAPLRSLTSSPLGPGPALAIEMPSAAPARVDLFDLEGRRVRTLANRDLPAGLTLIPWDGRDAAGRSLPRGIYFARLASPVVTATARVLLAPR